MLARGTIGGTRRLASLVLFFGPVLLFFKGRKHRVFIYVQNRGANCSALPYYGHPQHGRGINLPCITDFLPLLLFPAWCARQTVPTSRIPQRLRIDSLQLGELLIAHSPCIDAFP